MAKKKRGNSKGKGMTGKKWSGLAVAAVLLAAVVYYLFFTSMAGGAGETCIYIDDDDSIDSVLVKVKRVSNNHSYQVFRRLLLWSDYRDNIRTGRYRIGHEGALQTYRHIHNGAQASTSFTLKPVRTKEELAQKVGKVMMFSSAELLDSLNSRKVCKRYGYTPETIMGMFIPNTYDLYWDMDVSGFLRRMDKESKRFWDDGRERKAEKIGLTKNEVITLASIVDEETNVEDEMPMVAGMYMNRLHDGMRLQADPTVKFATGNFQAKRIYRDWLSTESPYNTYRYKGLPPGPIRIPSVAAIDAVLDYAHHDYMYMCAKPDFSGTHNFAKTYEEHQRNAADYAAALDKRGIK